MAQTIERFGRFGGAVAPRADAAAARLFGHRECRLCAAHEVDRIQRADFVS